MGENKENKVKQKRSFFSGNHRFFSLIVVLVVGISAGFIGSNQSINPFVVLPAETPINPEKTTEVNPDAVPVELFVMSQCPYGVMAENALIPVLEEFGNDVDFTLYFIASETETGFRSLHGETELNEDLRQICIAENYPQENFFNYLACVNTDYGNISDIWEGCASSNGIDVQKIKNCSESAEAEEILKEHIKKGDELGVSGSPTFYFNGERYSGNRTANAFIRAICESTPESMVCENLPPEVEVNLFVVNDLECELCDASGIIAQVESIFPKLNVEEIDFSSEEGQTHIKNFAVESVPFFFFDETVEKHENFATIERYLVKKNKYFELKVAGIKFIEREEVPNRVDLFVMSQCPYGTMAEAALIEITEAIPDLSYSIHFIATETTEGFISLHGEEEVAEDTRQACIMKYNEDKLLDYLGCLNEDYGNAGTVWKGCATEAGIDSEKIEDCSTSEEGENLLRENVVLSNEIEVNASPTFLLNNQITFGGIYAEQIKGNICSMNELDGCEKTLSGPAAAPTSTGGNPSC